VILQVKDNQEKLLKQCRSITQDYNAQERYASRGKEHGRKEGRVTRTFRIPDHQQSWFQSRGWKNVVMIIEVQRKREVFDTKSKAWKMAGEVAHYISTIPLCAEECDRGVRGHWCIENKNHHVRDVSMHEDASRIRCHPHIMAKMRSFALNVLRSNGEKNIGAALYRNALSLNTVLSYAHIF
jgi:predicted transposase YbfD/YdcC